MSCVGTEEQAGAKAPEQMYFKCNQVLHQAACDGGVWSCTRAVGSRFFPFFSKISAPTPPVQQMLQKSSKPATKVAVPCSPYGGGMPRTCTHMICYLFLFHGWELFSPSFLKPHDATLDRWSWSWLYVLMVHFLSVNCITALPPCLHKYMQYCSDSWAGHLRGMILPYNMHWDCVTILLEGKTLSDTNFK